MKLEHFAHCRIALVLLIGLLAACGSPAQPIQHASAPPTGAPVPINPAPHALQTPGVASSAPTPSSSPTPTPVPSTAPTPRPATIAGSVLDAHTGAPLPQVHVAVLPTPTTSASTRTDAHGQFSLPAAPDGSTLIALLPGYRRAYARIQPGERATLRLEPFTARAIYLPTGVAAQGMDTMHGYFDLIDHTELNALVLDLKSDTGDDIGMVQYASHVPQVRAAGTAVATMPLREILAEAKRRDIYMIARVQLFAHDHALLRAHPDWYVQQHGQPWRDDAGMAWLDAYDTRVWEYNIALGVEAAHLGFDEIQFDYIRFPSDGNLDGAIFKGPHGPEHAPAMYDTIGRLCAQAHAALNDAGAFLGVDVFGYVAWEPQPGIGQNLHVMSQHVDYVYPMAYPSHYVPGTLGFDNPDAHPFEVVEDTMRRAPQQLAGASTRAKIRGWLQAFSAPWIAGTISYGPDQIRAQIDATERHAATGTRGWALWSFTYAYPVAAFKPE